MSDADHSAYSGSRVLVTGGLGFIGSNLASRLVRLGAEVTIIDSLIPEYGGNLYNVREIADRVRTSFTDIRDPWSMRYLVQGQDFIFNLAGQVSQIDSIHRQPAFEALAGTPVPLGNAEALCGEVVSLPLYPELTDAEVEAVATATSEVATLQRG